MYRKIKKDYKKRVISIVIALVLVIGFTAPISAAEQVANYTLDVIQTENEHNVAEYVMNFVQSIYETPDLRTGDVIPFYSESEQLSGYCVDILDGTRLNGYVIVKFTNNEPVVSEFSIEPDVINPYMEIIDRNQLSTDRLTYYSIGENEYQIWDEQTQKAYGYGESTAIKDFTAYKEEAKATVRSGARGQEVSLYSDLDGWSVISDNYEGTVKSSNLLCVMGFYYGNDVEWIKEKYACAVVALCNLMKYYWNEGYKNISPYFSELYPKLWDYAGTNSDGSTNSGNIYGAAAKYIKEVGYGCTYNKFLLDRYTDFKSAIDNDKPCILSYGADFGGKAGGHSVLVIGYVETTAYQYLRVADGWTSSSRYLNFNGYDYNYKDGGSFTISK